MEAYLSCDTYSNNKLKKLALEALRSNKASEIPHVVQEPHCTQLPVT